MRIRRDMRVGRIVACLFRWGSRLVACHSTQNLLQEAFERFSVTSIRESKC